MMLVAIQFMVVFIECVGVAFASAAWSAGHAHGCRSIHANHALYCGMRAVANVRQQLVGHTAAIRTLDLIHADLFKIIMHSKFPFLS